MIDEKAVVSLCNEILGTKHSSTYDFTNEDLRRALMLLGLNRQAERRKITAMTAEERKAYIHGR